MGSKNKIKQQSQLQNEKMSNVPDNFWWSPAQPNDRRWSFHRVPIVIAPIQRLDMGRIAISERVLFVLALEMVVDSKRCCGNMRPMTEMNGGFRY